jgi:hypothetical protein
MASVLSLIPKLARNVKIHGRPTTHPESYKLSSILKNNSCFFMAKRTDQALFYLSLRFPESLQLHRRRYNSGCLAAESLGALCHHRRDTLRYLLATPQLRLAGDCNPSSSL